jgi:hypothetical protein
MWKIIIILTKKRVIRRSERVLLYAKMYVRLKIISLLFFRRVRVDEEKIAAFDGFVCHKGKELIIQK